LGLRRSATIVGPFAAAARRRATVADSDAADDVV